MNLKEPARVKLNSSHVPFSPVSATPGRTRHIFRFDISNRLCICDFPGYGNARAPRAIQETWNQLIEKYLNHANIARALILIDANQGIKPLDEEVMTMLEERGITVQIIITKVDLLSRSRLHEVVSQSVTHILRSPRQKVFPYIHAVSARNDLGMTELRCDIAAIANDLEVNR
jgi:GTP-binding protein